MSSNEKRCSSGVSPLPRTQSVESSKQISTFSRSKTCGFTGTTLLKPKAERLQPLPTNKNSQLPVDTLPDDVNKLHPAMINELCLHARGLCTIPNLSQFSKLQMLDLSCNSLTRIDNLRVLTNLRELKLYGNKIEQIENLEWRSYGFHPEFLINQSQNKISLVVSIVNAFSCFLTQLQILQLQFNEISKLGSGLVYLTRLQTLRLDSNKLSLIRPEELSKLSQLKILDTSDCPLENLDFINTLGSITEFRARHCALKSLPNQLRNLRYLTDLDLSDNELVHITAMKTFSSLRLLHLANNNIQDIQIISCLIHLNELNLSNNRIYSLPNSFSKLTELQCLNVANNRIDSWKDIDVLGRLNSLFILHIHANPFLAQEDNYIEKLSKVCASLEIIDDISIQNGQLNVPLTASDEQLLKIDNELMEIDQTLEKSIAEAQERIDTIMNDLQKLSEWYPDDKQEKDSSTDRSTGSNTSNSKPKHRLLQALTFSEENYQNPAVEKN